MGEHSRSSSCAHLRCNREDAFSLTCAELGVSELSPFFSSSFREHNFGFGGGGEKSANQRSRNSIKMPLAEAARYIKTGIRSKRYGHFGR